MTQHLQPEAKQSGPPSPPQGGTDSPPSGGSGGPSETNPHIFLAHADSDQPTVQKLRQWLNLHQQVAWVQAREISGGDNRAEIIAESIRTARHCVVLVSNDALVEIEEVQLHRH